MGISLSRVPQYACSSHNQLLSQALLTSPEGHASRMWACPRHQCSPQRTLIIAAMLRIAVRSQLPLPVQLSQARKQEGAAPTRCELRHTTSSTTSTSSMTTSSSLYTSSMSSTDTVLPKDPAALSSPDPGSLRKRASADVHAPLVSLPSGIAAASSCSLGGAAGLASCLRLPFLAGMCQDDGAPPGGMAWSMNRLSLELTHLAKPSGRKWTTAAATSCVPPLPMLAQASDHTAKERDGRRETHSGSGRAGHGFTYDTITKPGLKGGGAALFPDVKVAPTVFDGTHALGSALLIGACGGLTLLLRYCGSTFLD